MSLVELVAGSASGDEEALGAADSAAGSAGSGSVGSRRSTRLEGGGGLALGGSASKKFGGIPTMEGTGIEGLPEWACAGHVEEPWINAFRVELVVAGKDTNVLAFDEVVRAYGAGQPIVSSVLFATVRFRWFCSSYCPHFCRHFHSLSLVGVILLCSFDGSRSLFNVTWWDLRVLRPSGCSNLDILIVVCRGLHLVLVAKLDDW